MSLPASRLQRILSEPATPFRLGDYISRGFEFMNKNFGMLLGFMLVSGVISFFIQIVPVLGIVLSILIGPVLQIGYAQFAYKTTRDRNADFAEFFKGFNKIGPLVATYLLTAIVSLAAVLPGLKFWYQAGMWEFVQVAMEDYPFMDDVPDFREFVDMGMFWLGFVVMLIGALTLSVLFSWSLNVVWFFEVGPLEALNASRKLIARNWVSFILFIILAGIIAAAGLLLCVVGILYTAPAMACAQFFAFADSTRLLEDEAGDEPDLIDHFIA